MTVCNGPGVRGGPDCFNELHVSDMLIVFARSLLKCSGGVIHMELKV